MPRIFPNAEAENLMICVSGIGARSGFSAFISGCITEYETLDNSQCYPLYLYEEDKALGKGQNDLFSTLEGAPCKRRDAITDAGWMHFRSTYPDEQIGKEHVFYYVYGLLHSSEYREQYKNNLEKEILRIPRVRRPQIFGFSVGQDATWLNCISTTSQFPPIRPRWSEVASPEDYRVEKMKYGKKGGDKDLTTLQYNGKITVTGIPMEAYEYVINGKPALNWVVERQCVKTDRASGIVNDANDWAVETMNNPKYSLELFLRVITVSLETMRIVRSLPGLELVEVEA